MPVFYVLFFVLGTIFGSFLNVVINRLKTNKSILKERSHCPFCKKKLSCYELIPIISFIIQKGKCKNCHKQISWQYPLTELATGIIFLLIIFNFSAQGGQAIFNTAFLLLISCFLIIIFVYDLKHYLVPDIIIYPAIVISFLYQLQFSIFNFQFSINFQLPIFNYLIASIVAGGFFLVIVLISKGKWMGMGDVKIGILMGLILGIPQIFVALFLAFLIGAIISVILLILKKKTLKSEIPFGPFLIGATFIALFWGEFLLNWYLGLSNL
mgnify:CR=1 FL=1